MCNFFWICWISPNSDRNYGHCANIRHSRPWLSGRGVVGTCLPTRAITKEIWCKLCAYIEVSLLVFQTMTHFPHKLWNFSFTRIYITHRFIHTCKPFPPKYNMRYALSHINTFIKRFMHILNAFSYSCCYCCTSKTLLSFCNLLVSLHDHLLFSTIVQNAIVWVTGSPFSALDAYRWSPCTRATFSFVTPYAMCHQYWPIQQCNNMSDIVSNILFFIIMFIMWQCEQLGLDTYLLVTMCQSTFSWITSYATCH